MRFRLLLASISILLLACPAWALAAPPEGEGWVSLFDGETLDGWKVSEAAAESWSVVDGVIFCDPRSRKSGDRSIWTERSFGDFVLHAEWRFPEAPTTETHPLIGPDGEQLRDEQGQPKTATFPNADSGIYLRGMSKAQVNIWNWPVGSGEVWGYRTDRNQPAEVRAGVTPRVRADKPVGEWNTFVITMRGDRLTVVLNGETVLESAQLPGVKAEGPLALQYHGGYDHQNERYLPASSLVQFRNLYIKPLDEND